MSQNIITFTPSDNKISISVQLDTNSETVWLSLNQISDLFERDKSVISRHLKKIFEEEELDRSSVVAFFATTAADEKTYNVEYFNLDAILSVGYRVNSRRGTEFRRWTSQVLKDYLVKGYAHNQDLLLKSGLTDISRSLDILKKSLLAQGYADDIAYASQAYSKPYSAGLIMFFTFQFPTAINYTRG